MQDPKHHVLVVNEFHPETVAKLDARYQTHHLHNLDSNEKTKLIASLEGKCKAAASASWMCDSSIYSLGSLQLISAFGVGVDGIDFDATGKAGIKVTNTPDVLNDAVADLAIALILATSRNITNADKFARDGQWSKSAFPFGMSLAGKTLGIIGLGRIGEEIAHRALPFKLDIAYYNRREKKLPYNYHSSIQELASHSDILLCMLPGGNETNNLINAAVFENLGPDGIFINVGRGNSVDEKALAQALRNGTIKAAGLDVYKDEPNIPSSLTSLDNIVLLPHIGSATIETRREMGNVVVRNLEAFFAGMPLVTEVD